jgi:gluconate 2-dehydrogenase gamma chain
MMERRRFLSLLSLAALPASGCRRRRAFRTPSCAVAAPPPQGPGRVLDAAQWSTLRAACARLLPSDGEPGAEEAGVVAYIDAELAHPPVASFRDELLRGLGQLETLARRAGSSSFATLPAERQDALLQRLQRGSRHCFLVLLTLTMEGFLCDPIYGGNRDQVGWRFIAFSPRPPRPRCPYHRA